jgi:hypothetical protein
MGYRPSLTGSPDVFACAIACFLRLVSAKTQRFYLLGNVNSYCRDFGRRAGADTMLEQEPEA